MKQIFLLAFLLMSMAMPSFAQNCCSAPVSDFGMLALNEDFKKEHLDPLPIDYQPKTGYMDSFNTLDGSTAKAFYVPSDQPTSKTLIIIHEWWGLNDYIKREAERWQELLGNVDVYAVDLFDGKVAADAATASKLSSSLDKKRAENIIKGLHRNIGTNNIIGTLGWCLGGTWAFTASRLVEKQAAGCVMYYGFPEQDEKLISQMKTDVLYIWAARDKHITKDAVTAFGQKLEGAQRKFTMHTFDADHAFANPSNPVYDRLAARQAEQLAIAFLKKYLAIE